MIKPTKPIALAVDRAVTQAHLAASLQQQMATKSMQEVKETITREVLTSAKVQEGLGKILNKLA